LKEAQQFSWSDDSAKALVVIGDDVPHPPSYTTEEINWWDEMYNLIDMGVKIYGVRADHGCNSVAFYQELSECSGTVSITFKSFDLITNMV